MTATRIIAPGGTYAITRRCAFRKLFLTPLSEVIHDGMLYILGQAQAKYRVRLHHEVILPNHGHLCVTPTEANLPKFTEYFFGETSKFIKVALAEHGFEPPEKIWNGDRPHYMRLMDAGAQLVWLGYEHGNPVDAGLVERVEDYPGHVSDLGLLAGGTRTMTRPPFYCDPRNNSDEVTLHYSMPPCLKRGFGEAKRVIYHLEKATGARERACRARGGRVLGAERVKTQHPWSEPRSPRQFSRGPTPTFRTTVPGMGEVYALQTAEFRHGHEEERRKRLADERHEFPYGTYRMRALHGAPVAEAPPPGEDSVCAPGVLDAYGAPWSAVERRAATKEAMACAVDVTDAEETLAARIVLGAEDAVDRRAGPTGVDVDAEGHAAEGTPGKSVVLRSSTASARRRRRRIQAERAEREREGRDADEEHDDMPDPSPPPE